jgi:hypothetical protein
MHSPARNKFLASTARVDAEHVGAGCTELTGADLQETKSIDQHEAAPHHQPRRLMSARQLAETLNVSLSWVNKSHVYGTGPRQPA